MFTVKKFQEDYHARGKMYICLVDLEKQFLKECRGKCLSGRC